MNNAKIFGKKFSDNQKFSQKVRLIFHFNFNTCNDNILKANLPVIFSMLAKKKKKIRFFLRIFEIKDKFDIQIMRRDSR